MLMPARVFTVSLFRARMKKGTCEIAGGFGRGNEINDLPIDGRASTVGLYRTDFEFSDDGFRQFDTGPR